MLSPDSLVSVVALKCEVCSMLEHINPFRSCNPSPKISTLNRYWSSCWKVVAVLLPVGYYQKPEGFVGWANSLSVLLKCYSSFNTAHLHERVSDLVWLRVLIILLDLIYKKNSLASWDKLSP